MDINVTLIGQMITFMIFVIFTMKFVCPPLRKAMDKRKNKIQEGLLATEKAKQDLEIANRKINKMLQDAKDQSTKIIEQANVSASHIIEESKERARIEAQNIRNTVNDEVKVQYQLMKQSLRSEVVRLAILSAEKIIKNNIDMASNNQLLEELAAQL